MLGAALQCGDDRWRTRSIAERHGDIAQPALVAAATDGGAFGTAQEFVLLPGEQLHQGGAIQAVARGEIRLLKAPGKLVPGADKLAVVATKNAVADAFAQVFGDAALMLDGQITDAAARIQPVGGDDGLCRANVDAAAATAAMVAGRGGGRQRQVGV